MIQLHRTRLCLAWGAMLLCTTVQARTQVQPHPPERAETVAHAEARKEAESEWSDERLSAPMPVAGPKVDIEADMRVRYMNVVIERHDVDRDAHLLFVFGRYGSGFVHVDAHVYACASQAPMECSLKGYVANLQPKRDFSRPVVVQRNHILTVKLGDTYRMDIPMK